jgi:hypothetical protein
MADRRFPPPWSVDNPDMKLGQDCFIVRDADGPGARLMQAPARAKWCGVGLSEASLPGRQCVLFWRAIIIVGVSVRHSGR